VCATCYQDGPKKPDEDQDALENREPLKVTAERWLIDGGRCGLTQKQRHTRMKRRSLPSTRFEGTKSCTAPATMSEIAARQEPMPSVQAAGLQNGL